MPATIQEKAAALYAGVGLAPMVRASTTPLRALALHYGADFVYTEELIDRSLSGSIRVENPDLGCIDYVKDTSKLSKKVIKRLQKENGGGPVRAPVLLRIDRSKEGGKLICQIGSGEPELALAAALHVHQDVDAIDINMGCPKKFSVSGGMGSALLSDPDRACRIIETLDKHLTPLGLPVSAKIRLLKDVNSTVDFITRLIQAGAKAVAVHGRRVGDEAIQAADWDTLRAVVSAAKTKHPAVPILLNGDFYTRKEFEEFQQSTGANGVILARPALYNTSIFRKKQPAPLVPSEKNTDAGADADCVDAAVDDYGYQSKLLLDKTVVVQDYLRQAVRYDTHYKNTKYVVCEMMSNRRTPTNRVPFLPQRFPAFQTVGKVCDSRSLDDLCRVWNVDYNHCLLSRRQGQNTTTKEQPQAPAGEHKYLDSYFLDNNRVVAPETEKKNDANDHSNEKNGEAPVAKRMRVEGSSSDGQ